MKNMKSVYHTYKDIKNETLYRDILLFALMCHPAYNESSRKKRHAHELKVLIKFYGDISDRIMQESPEVDLIALSNRIGIRMSNYIAAIGGWGIFSELFLVGTQTDFFDELRAQRSKGITVGIVLHETLRKKCGIYKAASDYSSSFKLDHEFIGKLRNSKKEQLLRIEPKTFCTTIWQEFKHVAHLWAAFNTYVSPEIDLSISPVIEFDRLIPKDASHGQACGYRGFCETAEYYRALGCSFKPLRSAHTVLSPESCIHLVP